MCDMVLKYKIPCDLDPEPTKLLASSCQYLGLGMHCQCFISMPYSSPRPLTYRPHTPQCGAYPALPKERFQWRSLETQYPWAQRLQTTQGPSLAHMVQETLSRVSRRQKPNCEASRQLSHSMARLPDSTQWLNFFLLYL